MATTQVAEHELDPILARPRIVHHRPDQLVLLAVHEHGDRRAIGGPRRIRCLLAPSTHRRGRQEGRYQHHDAASAGTGRRQHAEQPGDDRNPGEDGERRRQAEVGCQDAPGEPEQPRREHEACGAHASPGGGDGLDVLQLSAVDDAALHGIIE